MGDTPNRPDASPLTLEVTAWGAFAAAAVVVSGAALIFTLGRRFPQTSSTVGSATPAVSAGELPTVDYEQLQIDPGSRR